MADQSHYRVVFQAQGKVYEVYAGEVSHHGMLGFVEIGQLDFPRRTELVLDPTEERLRSEFEGVKRTWLPMHSIIRIDEVDKRGVSKVSDAPRGSNVTPLPIPYPQQGGDPPKAD
jgi:hypothetical protein